MKPFSRIAAIVFFIVAVAHLLRLIFGWKVIFGDHELPMWISIFGLVFPLILSIGLWRESRA